MNNPLGAAESKPAAAKEAQPNSNPLAKANKDESSDDDLTGWND